MKTVSDAAPRLSVLIVDDERIVRTSLAIYFDDVGYRVLEAENGLSAIELCHRDTPDLVFTDLRMPGMDGFGVVERLNADFPELPVVVISGVGNVNEAIKALHLGAWDYITKPIEDLEIIEITSKRVLERARLKRENREYRQRLEQLVAERTRQLTESEERFHQLFLQHEDAIMLATADTFTIVELNPACIQLFGYDAAQLSGRSAALLFSAKVWDELRSGLTARKQKDYLFYEQLAAVAQDGTPLTISFKGWHVEIGPHTYYYFSMRNMREKVQLEQEIRASQARLIHANKMTSLGILLSGMAHEINNPNNFIGVNAALLADIWRDAGPQLEELAAAEPGATLGGLAIADAVENGSRLIDGILRGSSRIDAVVTGLKSFSRADTSGLEGRFDLCRVIQDARTILDHHIQSRTDCFSISCQEGLPAIRGSHQQIEQVVINLLVNALQALPDRSRGVRIQAGFDQEARQVVFTVVDEGQGMSPEVCERIAEPFFTTRIDEGGTGLGLSISSSIVRDHKGTITFQSEAGQGTTVTVRLPAAEA